MIVDANVMVSAVLGRSLELLVDVRSKGIELLAPAHQLAEALSVVYAKGKVSKVQLDVALEAVLAVVDELDQTVYLSLEQVARSRLGKRGQPDWPVLASALALDDAIWSNDRDLFGVGVTIWSTRDVGMAEAAA